MVVVDRFVAKRWPLIISILAALAVLSLRVWLLARYSSSLPYWDAWGAEPMLLYGNWLNDSFAWGNLWAWHNEHRIFFTRTLDLLLFLANEAQWDDRVQTLASGVLYAVVAGVSVRWILRHVEAPLSLGLSGVVILCAASPNGWANANQGFQSCFYFVLLFATLSVRSAAQTAISLRGGVQTAVLALAAVFSLAGGVFAAITCAAIAMVRVWIERSTWQRAVAFLAAPMAIAIWSLVDAKKGELHTTTITAFLHSLAIMMSWPYASFFGALFWVPVGVYAVHVLRTRSATGADLLFGGLALWVLLIDVAAAWVRAYNFVDVQSRYTDLMIPSLIAQIYFAYRVVELFWHDGRGAVFAKVAATGVGGLLCLGVANSSVSEFQNWKRTDFYLRIGATYVRAYVDGDATALDGRLYGYVPYPVPDELKPILDDPTVRSILPLSIAPSIPLADQRLRSCRWIPDRGSILPVRGRVVCGSRDKALSAAGEHYVGRLSAVTYQLWSLIGRQSYPVFQREREKRSQPTERANCAVDNLDGVASPSGQHSVPFADVITFAGWIGPSAPGAAQPAIQFELSSEQLGRFSVNTVAGVARPDVAKGFQTGGYDYSGFQTYLDGSGLPAGSYRLKVFTATGAECDSGIDVNIDHDADIRLAY